MRSRLKKRGDYWIAVIKGRQRAFGNWRKVPHGEALEKFVAAVKEAELDEKRGRIRRARKFTAKELRDDYHEWCERHQAEKTVRAKFSVIDLFLAHKPRRAKTSIGCMRADAVTAGMLEQYFQSRMDRGEIGPTTAWHIVTDVRAMWNWGAGTVDHAASHLPEDFRPFKNLKKPQKTRKSLSGDMLLTASEIETIVEAAETHGLADLIRVLRGTGARPGELCSARVRDFHGDRLVLHEHKNATRSETAKARVIALASRASKIVLRLCNGRDANDPIFTGPMGAAWHPDRVSKIFRKIRQDNQLRDHLVPYSFRDLWISTALQKGIPIATVAAAAGTSTDMIQATYGHFHVADLVAVAAQVDV